MCCGAGLSAEGTDWETGTGGCWVITWPRGCLFKPKSCLDYCTQTLLLCRSCMRHKGRELEIGRTTRRGSEEGKERAIIGGGEKEGRKRQGLDNVIPPSQEAAQTISKNERAQWTRRGDEPY